MATPHSRLELALLTQEDQWFSCLLATLTRDRQRARNQFKSLFGVFDSVSALKWALEFEGNLVRCVFILYQSSTNLVGSP
jgi:hypothetical protein